MRRLALILGLTFIPQAVLAHDYMAELREREKAFSEAPAGERNFAAQMLAFSQSYVDASEGPAKTYLSGFPQAPVTPEQAAKNADRARKLLEEHQPRAALAAIVAAARDRQIVIINEAHFSPRHRAFSALLALELRKLGFEYLAVETLDNRGPEVIAAMQARGYPLVDDGYYSKEPVFGDLLRRALASGFRPIAYEFTAYAADYEKLDMVERQVRREEGQAQNIFDRVLAKNPHARLLVHVGHGHVSKGLVDFAGHPIAMMAERLRSKSGIDPLCIEQTRSAWPANVETDGPIMAAAARALPGEAFVMARRNGTGFWNTGDVDITVWHPPEILRRGRPDWLSMRGYREPRKIPTKLLPKTGRRLVQAFVAGESADAVPMDQVLVTAGETPPVFILPKGKYRFAYQD
jgi:hypothetical protein